MNKPKKLEPIYYGQNDKGMFLVDEDDGQGRYSQQRHIEMLIWKLNEVINHLSKLENEKTNT